MSSREQSLAQRREELVARSAAQRAAISAQAAPLLRKAATLDRIVARVRQYPVVTALGVGAVALLGTRRIFELATRVLTLYALFRR
jgi:YqjK-like protein